MVEEHAREIEEQKRMSKMYARQMKEMKNND